MFDRVPMLGQVGITSGAGGANTVSVTPTVHDGGFVQQEPQFFPQWWGYPQYPQYPSYPPQQRMVCRKLEDQSKKEGRDVFECESQPVARPAMANYPVVTYPLSSWNWWF